MPSTRDFPYRFKSADIDSFRKSRYAKNLLHEFLREILRPRLIEERMLLSLRQGKISKWFAGIGQEAIAVGATLAMQEEEYILPLHRNLGVFTTRGVPVSRLVAQFQGAEDGFTQGRDRSFHFGSLDHRIIGMISHLGPQLCVADGIGLSHTLREEERATLVFCGDGCTSEGDFHEALNLASVWELPVIFLVENNGYGLSTPINEQFKCQYLSDRAHGYGMEGVTIDGNDLLEVYEAVRYYAQRIRKKPEPVLIECLTFRMRGHEEASGTKYVPDELMEYWTKRDPVARFEREVIRNTNLTRKDVQKIREELEQEIAVQVEEGFASPLVSADTGRESRDVFSQELPPVLERTNGSVQELRYVDAAKQALEQAMERHDDLLIMGQDVAEYGGVFKVTEGFSEKFGSKRVRNTPLCESAVLGSAVGLSAQGFRSVVEMQFSDFVSSGFTQVINNIAKLHYRWGHSPNVVVRMPCGAGVGAGPFHSQTSEAWFFHTPGLKIAYPAFPYDVKGLLLRAIQDPNPVMFFEHKALYRSIRGDVPESLYEIEFGKARRVREGQQIAIITYGAGVHWALRFAEENPESDPLILDLRTLAPLDWEAVREVVEETSKVLVLHEANLTGGVGGEIASYISQHCFEHLDAPVMRCASLDTPVPFAKPLEEDFLASSRLKETVDQLIAY